MTNELWSILIGPILVGLIFSFAWIIEHFFSDCNHKWGAWVAIDPKNEAAYIQQRFCRKCNMRQINQIKKEKNGSTI